MAQASPVPPALSPQVMDMIDYVRRNNLTYCARPGKLEGLSLAISHLRRHGITGAYVEAGVAMGGSAIVITALKQQSTPLYLYDVYDMLPPPSAADGAKAQAVYQGFTQGTQSSPVDRLYLEHASKDMLDFVHGNLTGAGFDPAAHNVHLIKGRFTDTLHVNEPVALAHIDCDWHDSVSICIERLADHMTLGGLMIFDDYGSFEGCRRAVDAWLSRDPRFAVVVPDGPLIAQRR